MEFNNNADLGEDTLFEQEDMISEREVELDEAVAAFLDTVLEQDSLCALSSDEIYRDIKDHFLTYLARAHKLKIRRPMILKNAETGENLFTEYPYEHIVFDGDG